MVLIISVELNLIKHNIHNVHFSIKNTFMDVIMSIN